MNNVDLDTDVEGTFREAISSCKSLSKYEINLKITLPQMKSCITTAVFHLIIGITFAYSAVLIPQLESPTSDIPNVTEDLTSLVASIIVLMVPVGGVFTGFIMEKIGRLNTLTLAAVPFVAGWVMIASSTNIYWILGGRVLHGFSCALATSPAIVYMTEVSRPDLRGSLISLGQSIASLGNIIAYAKGTFLDWRLCAWLYIFYSIVPAILVKFIPESPIWLVGQGRIEDAARSLKILYKRYPQPENTKESLADLKLKELLQEKEKRLAEDPNVKKQSRWRAFTRPSGYKPLVILFFLFIIQQFSGVYITLFYAVTFLKETGTDVDAFAASIFVGVVRFIMSLINLWLLKRFKRRHLLMISSLFMALCMFVSGAVTIWIKDGATGLSLVPVICLLLYVCSAMVGMLSIPWTMTAELFPNEIRELGHAFAFSVANIIMFSAIQNYRNLIHLLGGSEFVQWFFAFMSVLGFLFALFFLPETHGKKLSDIQAYFESKPPLSKLPTKSSPSGNFEEIELKSSKL